MSTMMTPDVIHEDRPSTDTGDMALRMCRAERRIEALTAVVEGLLASAPVLAEDTARPDARPRPTDP
ncbi:hypothetical protein ABT297_35415 [Dactylosporangium sp. NPDC000555]|uniref:hypothetical protein n=1 Tax=Dactylosporangium sp. NPDC000555 TaxID=3154260 RepID=UPI00333302AA